MGILVVFVPGLLVVVLGYAVGHTVWEAAGAPGDPEIAGWITGFVLLVAVTVALLAWHRRFRRRRRAGHRKVPR